MMGEEECYLLNNLVALGAGQSTGRFNMGGHFSRIMFRIYAAPLLHVEFVAPQLFHDNLAKFMANPKAAPFCVTLYQLLDRSSGDLCGMAVGKRGALGLMAMLDQDVRDAASGGEPL